jgi:hypothetical protein
MSFVLTNDMGDELTCGGSAWDFYCCLADDYGWKRLGTLPPEGVAGGEWDGGYSSNDGQRVTAEDATLFASALQQNREDPNRAVRQRQVIRRLDAEVRRMALEHEGIELPDESDTEPLPDDADLDEVIRFLHKGGFKIE